MATSQILWQASLQLSREMSLPFSELPHARCLSGGNVDRVLPVTKP